MNLLPQSDLVVTINSEIKVPGKLEAMQEHIDELTEFVEQIRLRQQQEMLDLVTERIRQLETNPDDDYERAMSVL